MMTAKIARRKAPLLPIETVSKTINQLQEMHMLYDDSYRFVPAGWAKTKIAELEEMAEAAFAEREAWSKELAALRIHCSNLEVDLKKYKPYTPDPNAVVIPDLDAIALQYAAHLEKEAQRIRAQVAQRQEKAKKHAEMEAKIAELNKPKVCRVSHPCSKCGGIIVKGEQATSYSVVTGYGYPEGNHYATVYQHYPVCPGKVEEA